VGDRVMYLNAEDAEDAEGRKGQRRCEIGSLDRSWPRLVAIERVSLQMSRDGLRAFEGEVQDLRLGLWLG